MRLALEVRWEIVRGTKVSSDLTITYDVPPFSHNVVAKWNMATGWIPKMANHYEKLCPLKSHYPATKCLKKPHIQLLCNYPLGITTIMQLSP
jgi:hypothetical protein